MSAPFRLQPLLRRLSREGRKTGDLIRTGCLKNQNTTAERIVLSLQLIAIFHTYTLYTINNFLKLISAQRFTFSNISDTRICMYVQEDLQAKTDARLCFKSSRKR